MRKVFGAVFTVIVAMVLAVNVNAEDAAEKRLEKLKKESKFKDCDCHEPTWERLTLVMLDANVKYEETTVDSFACGGGMEESMGKKFYCDKLVARFTPQEHGNVESRFDLRDACEKAKKVAKKRLEEYRNNRCFVVTRHDKLGKYDFSRKAFPIKDLNARGVPFEVPKKYEKLDTNWPSAMFDASWCMNSFRLTVPQVIEELEMSPDKAEKFAANNDKVFVKYKFTLNGDYEMQRTGINNGIYEVEAWMYESEDMENLLAKDRNFDSFGFTSNPVEDV